MYARRIGRVEGDDGDVIGAGGFDRLNLQARPIDQLDRATRVEDMMMETSILEILRAARFEVLEAAAPRILLQIVELQDLRQVRKIVLARLPFVVLDEVL